MGFAVLIGGVVGAHRARPKMDRANDPRYNFDADPSLDEIIAQQGKGPITDLSVLHGDFWPEEESIEDFLAALHEWRDHKRKGPTA
ncbi:MAG: hypothetical protein HYR60_17555 [Acidobacteria bacterium]|nr:hypothetical protein [Acidobacteriota bacterium]MBI3470945.1 hypothetical protein [Candidatus Solibacter usitatus]